MNQELKFILSLLKEHRGRLTAVIVTGLLTAGLQLLQPQFTKKIFDNLSHQKTEGVQEAILSLVVIMALMLLFRYIHLVTMNITSEKVVQKIRQLLQKKLMRLNAGFHGSFESGSGGLMSRTLNDVITVFHGMRIFADVAREPFILVGSLGWLFYLNPKLTLLILVAVPPLAIATRQISRSIKKYVNRGQEEMEVMTSTLKETLDGVRVIQSFVLENDMEDRFKKESERYIEARSKVYRAQELASPINELVMVLMTGGIVLVFAHDISAGTTTPGAFIAYIQALLMLGTPFKKIQESVVRLQESAVSLKRVLSILNNPNEVAQSTAKSRFPKDWNTISYEKVNFAYADKPILKNFSLKIQRGQVVAFVGASGSGKSTVVNLLERFFDPTSGSIQIDETPLQNIDLDSLRKNIALVNQDVFLFSDSVENNIWFGNRSRSLSEIYESAKAANADNFIQKKAEGYKTKVGDRGGLLSGGEKQRISIARAMFKDAPILILDEATSALDSESELEVQKGLDQLMQGRTVLVIAHRLSTITKADKIVVMKAGEIVEVGTHQELITQGGEYQRLFEIQFNQLSVEV
ncbi:MAG: ABC transporter ATP-binding protein/permease [Proteobacteria bacterium]|nr:ABC transporter ATP-binding protein/permease [Pseudomonadota bacterium]